LPLNWIVLPLAMLAAYGALRFSTTLFAELRDLVFVRVTQRAVRRVALTVFRHLHSPAQTIRSEQVVRIQKQNQITTRRLPAKIPTA